MSISAQEKRWIDNDTLLTWHKERKLEWKDFQGMRDSLNYPNYDAVTNAEIRFTSGFLKTYDFSKINVFAFFNKKKSWTCSNTKETLQHEQLHFDIMELFARKMRSEFSKEIKKEVVDANSYFDIYQKQFNKCSQYQQLYDIKTEHGNIEKKQLQWNEKTHREMDSLQDFRYIFNINDVIFKYYD